MTDESITSCAADHEALANEVFDHLEAHFLNDATNGFDVYACSETGAAAVGYRPGAVGAQASIRRQVMEPWARSLSDAGFAVRIEYSGDGDQQAPIWLHITGRDEVDERERKTVMTEETAADRAVKQLREIDGYWNRGYEGTVTRSFVDELLGYALTLADEREQLRGELAAAFETTRQNVEVARQGIAELGVRAETAEADRDRLCDQLRIQVGLHADDEDCWYDEDGPYCEVHGHLWRQPKNPCPYQAARALLAEMAARRG